MQWRHGDVRASGVVQPGTCAWKMQLLIQQSTLSPWRVPQVTMSDASRVIAAGTLLPRPPSKPSAAPAQPSHHAPPAPWRPFRPPVPSLQSLPFACLS